VSSKTQAIEAQDAVNRPRANTGSSNLLPNVPAEAINIFTTPPVDTTDNAATQDHLPNSGLNNDSRPPPIKRNESHRTAQSSNTPPHTDLGKRRGGAGARPKKQIIPKPPHRRNQTMEQTLAGLSQALAGMNQTSTHGSSVEGDPVGEMSAHSGNPAAAASSGETLARNANVLFGGRQKTGGAAMMEPPIGEPVGAKNGGGGEGSSAAATTTGPKKAAQNWGKLRNVIKATGGAPKHPPITTADEDPSNSSRSYRSGEIPGSVHIHRPTDSGRVSDFCGPIEETGEEEEDIEIGGRKQQVAFQGGSSGDPNESGGEKRDETGARMSKRKQNRKSTFKKSTTHIVAQSGFLRDFQIFLGQRRASFITYLWFLLLVGIPATIVAFILFYAFDNPPTGRVDPALSDNGVLVSEVSGELINPQEASASWWIIFVCVSHRFRVCLRHPLRVVNVHTFPLLPHRYAKL